MLKIMNAILPLVLAAGGVGCAEVHAPSDGLTLQLDQQTEITLECGMLHALRRECYTDSTKNFSVELKASVSESALKELHSDWKERKEPIAQWRLVTLWSVAAFIRRKSGRSSGRKSLKLDNRTLTVCFM